MNRLPHHQEIYNTLSSLGLALYYSKAVMNHLVHLIDGMMTKGFTGTLTDLHRLSHHAKHRTTLSHFLNKGVWDESRLLQVAQRYIVQHLQRVSKQTKEPIFLTIDDTICEKTKPSSQAQSPIQGCEYHFSHTDRKFVWGHQSVWMMMRCAHWTFPYAFRRYEKSSGISKISLALQMIQTLCLEIQRAYVLFDSWYTSKSLMEACLQKGFHVIAALKTNRVLFPQGIRMQAKEFARYIKESDTHLVTVGEETYRVYRYEGALKDLEDAVVLFCWKADQPMTKEYVRCFLSTDTELSNQTILEYYAKRWSIESYFQQAKGMLSLDGYRVRRERAIERYWTIVQFTYVYSMMQSLRDFSTGLAKVRSKKAHQIVEFIYYGAQQGIPIDSIKKQLQIA